MNAIPNRALEPNKDARIVCYDGDTFHQNYPSFYPHRKYCLTKPLLLPECGLESVVTLTRNLAHNCLHDNPDRGIPTFHLRNDGAKTACGKILSLPGVVAIKVTAYDLDVYVALAFDFDSDYLHSSILRILADSLFYSHSEVKVIDRNKNTSRVIKPFLVNCDAD